MTTPSAGANQTSGLLGSMRSAKQSWSADFLQSNWQQSWRKTSFHYFRRGCSPTKKWG